MWDKATRQHLRCGLNGPNDAHSTSLTYCFCIRRFRSCFPTSCLCDAWVGSGLHWHGCGCPIADGGGGEVSKPCLSSNGLTSRTAPIAERVLDHSLIKKKRQEQVSQQLWNVTVHFHFVEDILLLRYIWLIIRFLEFLLKVWILPFSSQKNLKKSEFNFFLTSD